MPRMKTHRPLTTARQRQRLALWALTMLRWIAAVLFAGKPVTAHQVRARHGRVSLDGLTRLVVQLLIIRSAEFMQRKRKPLRFFRHGRDLKRRHYIRSLLGARLRRALKPKSIAARIDALIRVLRDLDLYARQLMKRRLTRLWSVKPAPTQAASILSTPVLALAFTDSS
jgi:hypothetical protein